MDFLQIKIKFVEICMTFLSDLNFHYDYDYNNDYYFIIIFFFPSFPPLFDISSFYQHCTFFPPPTNFQS